MNKFTRLARTASSPFAAALLLAVAGCATLEPRVPAAAPDVAGQWPVAPASSAGAVQAPAADAVAGQPGWRDFFTDPRLESLLEQALRNNRDLRVAALNVQRARALYRVQRAARLPGIEANAALQRSGGDGLRVQESASASVDAGIELDLFGRVAGLSKAAMQRYLATDQARHDAQLALVGEVASVYLALAADHDAQRIAEATLATYEAGFTLASKRHELGAISALDLQQSRTQVESARADAARYAGQVAQDRNALTLLVGAPVATDLLPLGLGAPVSAIAALPAELPSNLLLRRPDVRAAEFELLAANADIGAARAAFFPSISLTGSAGSGSDALSGLFGGGNGVWSFVPRLNLPIFQGGRLRANLGVATADRDIALARYEQAIQVGFREVADALALSGTLAVRRQAQERLVEAAARADALSLARFDAGRDSYLVRLDTQRTLYAAQQGLVTTRLAEQANRVRLYTALGGGGSGQDR